MASLEESKFILCITYIVCTYKDCLAFNSLLLKSVQSTRVAALCRRGLTPTVEPCGGNVGGSRNVSVAHTLLQIDKLGYPPCARRLLC